MKKDSSLLFTIKVTRRKAQYAMGAAVAILLLLVIARAFHWWNWGLSAQQIQQRQVASLVAKVGNLMLLPTGETPVVATITDASSLKAQQPFYKDAQNGDMIMVYTKAERAIVYRPSENKIINVGPIYLNKNAGTSSGSVSVPVGGATSSPSSIASTTGPAAKTTSVRK